MQIVVMAGGLATRMRPLTEKIPKSLLPVNNIPFVDYQMGLFRDGGITEVVFCVGYLGEMIEQRVGDGNRWGIRVLYSWEGEGLLGTGGALKNAKPLLRDIFLLTWGDSYVRADYAALYRIHESSIFPISVGVFKNINMWDRSNIEFQDGRVVKYQKGSSPHDLQFIDVGLSVFKRQPLDEIPSGAVSLDDIWQKLSAQGMLGGIEVHERFYEIGSRKGYEEFRKLATSLSV